MATLGSLGLGVRGSPGSMAINPRKEASLACRFSGARLRNEEWGFTPEHCGALVV